jgi:hypothetical protein
LRIVHFTNVKGKVREEMGWRFDLSIIMEDDGLGVSAIEEKKVRINRWIERDKR